MTVFNKITCSTFAGRGVPDVLSLEKRMTVPIPEEHLPCANNAAELYFADTGNRLTRPSVFGRDPFHSEEQKATFETQFLQHTVNMQSILSAALHGDYTLLQEALLSLIDIIR